MFACITNSTLLSAQLDGLELPNGAGLGLIVLAVNCMSPGDSPQVDGILLKQTAY